MGNETSKKSKKSKSEKQNDGVLLNSEYEYIYAKRRCQYRTEQLEISPDEVELIKKLQNSDDMKYDPYKEILALSNNKPVKIIIDTDIGTDIDDVFTLLLLSHLPKQDVQILGITTNYRPTILRKHIAESILKQTKNNENDLSSIPVIAGNCYLCGTHRPFYYAGNEGKGLGIDEKDDELMKKLWHNTDSEAAEDFIYEQLCAYPKQITILSIGIPTNIGNLVHKYGKDKIEALIGHIVVMGGGSIMDRRGAIEMKGYGKYSGSDSSKWKTKWDTQNEEIKIEFNDLPNGVWNAIKWVTPHEMEKAEKRNVVHLYPNHNLSGDTLASMMMFELKCPISLIPHHITRKHMLKGKAIETLLLLATKCDIKKQIYEENENGICACLMREWFRKRRGQRCQCLHDPLTLYEAIYCKEADSMHNEKEKETMNENKDEHNDNDDDFELGKESCLRYCNGTIVVHEWAAFVTFVPHKNGPHRFAYKVINTQKWIKWCGDTMIKNVAQENITENAGNYKKLMNTYGSK